MGSWILSVLYITSVPMEKIYVERLTLALPCDLMPSLDKRWHYIRSRT